MQNKEQVAAILAAAAVNAQTVNKTFLGDTHQLVVAAYIGVLAEMVAQKTAIEKLLKA